jgi:hypothetical protein
VEVEPAEGSVDRRVGGERGNARVSFGGHWLGVGFRGDWRIVD